MDSHTKMRENLQVVNDTFNESFEAQEEHFNLQAIRIKLVEKTPKGDNILCSLYALSDNIGPMMQPEFFSLIDELLGG